MSRVDQKVQLIRAISGLASMDKMEPETRKATLHAEMNKCSESSNLKRGDAGVDVTVFSCLQNALFLIQKQPL